PTASRRPSATGTAGASASSRSGAAGSCTSWAGSPTPARAPKGRSAPRPALAEAGACLEAQFTREPGDRFFAALDAAGIVALGRVALHQGDARLQQRTARLARALLADPTPHPRRGAA